MFFPPRNEQKTNKNNKPLPTQLLQLHICLLIGNLKLQSAICLNYKLGKFTICIQRMFIVKYMSFQIQYEFCISSNNNAF